MIVKQAEFITSLSNSNLIGEYDDLPQFTFVGRSNVGKSSLINFLTNRKSLAKTSSTPGRTRLINYFKINNSFYFVDLPGYGFALASKKEQSEWQSLIGGYLQNANNLKMVFVLVDIRHEPSKLDKQMVEYLYQFQIPFCIVATKADKIGKSQIAKNIQTIANTLSVGTNDIMYVSSEKKQGAELVLNKIEEILKTQ